jgi:hypothetical protein
MPENPDPGRPDSNAGKEIGNMGHPPYMSASLDL